MIWHISSTDAKVVANVLENATIEVDDSTKSGQPISIGAHVTRNSKVVIKVGDVRQLEIN